MNIVFDLSEVLISGLLGTEKQLSKILNIRENLILSKLGSLNLQKICRGLISEEDYIKNILKNENWPISITEIKTIFRENFKNKFEHSIRILKYLENNHNIIIFSDHAKEWIKFIENFHYFLKNIKNKLYSYETGYLKTELNAFKILIEKFNLNQKNTIFIDDNIKNIEIGKKINIDCIQFQNSFQLENELVKRGIQSRESTF